MISDYILRYTSPNEPFEYGYPHSNAFLHLLTIIPFFSLIAGLQAACHPTKCDLINDIICFRQFIPEYCLFVCLI